MAKEYKMKATKKPVTIECFKYDGDLINSEGKFYVPDWAKEAFEKGILYYGSKNEGEPPCELFVKTNHGAVHVAVDDYVIRQIDGELYPCKPDVFEKTYDIETIDTPDDALTHSYQPRREDIEIVNLAYERGLLGERIQKLSKAIKADPTAVSDHHKDLWKKQLTDMKGYYHTLGERIKDMVDTSEK